MCSIKTFLLLVEHTQFTEVPLTQTHYTGSLFDMTLLFVTPCHYCVVLVGSWLSGPL